MGPGQALAPLSHPGLQCLRPEGRRPGGGRCRTLHPLLCCSHALNQCLADAIPQDAGTCTHTHAHSHTNTHKHMHKHTHTNT